MMAESCEGEVHTVSTSNTTPASSPSLSASFSLLFPSLFSSLLSARYAAKGVVPPPTPKYVVRALKRAVLCGEIPCGPISAFSSLFCAAKELGRYSVSAASTSRDPCAGAEEEDEKEEEDEEREEERKGDGFCARSAQSPARNVVLAEERDALFSNTLGYVAYLNK